MITNTNIHKIFIDSKLYQDKSKIKIELKDEYIRKFKKSKFYRSKFFISVNQFFIFNQFNNISKNVNDTIQFFTVNVGSVAGDIETDGTLFQLENTFILKQGNPNVNMLLEAFNDKMKTGNTYNIELSFDRYTNKFQFQNLATTDIYLQTTNSKLVYGFSNNNFYRIPALSSLSSSQMINLMGDTLILFNLGIDSDIQLKNVCYDNVGKSRFELTSVFHILPINKNTSETLVYNRNDCLDKSEIIFDHNSLRQITLEIFNQDFDYSDISDYFLQIEIIEEKQHKFFEFILIFLQYIIQLII